MRLSITRSLALLGMAIILFAATAHASEGIAQGAAIAAATEEATTTTAAVERPQFLTRKYQNEELDEVRSQIVYWLCLFIQDYCQGWFPGPGGPTW
jgi:hypothetical protein